MQLNISKLDRRNLGLLSAVVVLSLCGYAQAQDAPAVEAVANKAPDTPPVAPAQPSASFDLLELRVKGNQQLDKQAIERTVYPFLGKQKSISNVEQARSALENLYRNKGYQTVSVDIPEQNVVGGVVYLQVVEGKVSRLRVTDSRYFSLGAIKAKVPALAEGSVPNMPQMQEQLAALAKESPDRSVTPVLRAGETPGTLEVDLKVKDELPLHGKVELNGRNTYTTDRLRAIGSIHYDNLWQKLHSASLMYQFTPENPNQVEVIVGSYALPLFDSDKRLALFVINSSSNTPVSNSGGSTTIGAGSVYGARFVDPLPTSIKNYYHTFTAGVTYKDQSLMQNALGSNVPSHYTNMPFTFGYSGNLQNPDSLLGFNLNANLSFRNFVNNQQSFTDSSTHAGNFQTDFMYLTGGVNYNHNLPYGMELASRFTGQVANTPLQVYEQFSLGGQQSVRGYYETQALADDGVQGSLELLTPKFNIDDAADYNRIRGLVFVDAGKGWKTSEPGLTSQVNTVQNLISFGSGFRLQLWKALTANFDVGVPLTSFKAQGGRVESGNPRLHFQIFTEF